MTVQPQKPAPLEILASHDRVEVDGLDYFTPAAGQAGKCILLERLNSTHPSVLNRFVTASTSSGEDSSNDSTTSSAEVLDVPEEIPFMRFQTAESYPCSTDLNHFHDKACLTTSLIGGFTKVKALSACCKEQGEVELHNWSEVSDASVVVKRVRSSYLNANRESERDERAVHRHGASREMEDNLTEIGIYCYMQQQKDRSPYLLKMYQAFEVQSDAWLVLEHADGRDLFDVITSQKTSPTQAMEWTRQLLEAVNFLHKHFIGHRDISIENILLHRGSIQLMDFGQAVQTHSTAGDPLRYFCALGKPYYRAPERYVPVETEVNVVAPRGCCTGEIAFVQTGDYMCEVLLPLDAVAGHECIAETLGYTVAPADVFACGVCFFVLATSRPPWQQARASDPHFSFVQKEAIALLLEAHGSELQHEAVRLLSTMVQANPLQRPTVADCLMNSAFTCCDC